MNKLYIILIGLFLLTACKKEVVIYDAKGDDNFELVALLNLAGKDCFYDSEFDVLKFSLSEADAANFNPLVKFEAGTEILFAGKLLKNNAVNSFGDIEINKAYAVVLKARGETLNTQLVFTAIPTVQIVVLDEVENEPKTLGKLTINYPELDRPSQVNWIGLEFRGASSLRYDKKSYGFRIYNDKSTENESHAAFFDFENNEDWILDALYIDQSKLRNKTSFELWQSMGDAENHVSIESRYVELFMNNNALGLYAFTEDFTARLLDLNGSSVLYKGTDNSEATHFEELPHKAPLSSKWGDWQQKYPKPSETIVWDDFQALNELVIKADDADFKANIGQQIDLDNIIDYFLLVNLCSAYDNIGKNWCFLKRNSTDKFIIVPWDLDATWGRDATGDFYASQIIQTNKLFNRLIDLNPDDFNFRLQTRWYNLRKDQFSVQNLSRLFGINFDLLREYNVETLELRKWDIPMNLSAEESYINAWIEKRLVVLDEKFN
ncbi:CotH kinase family protein [Crocinitomix catalasitica]|uniref:CotH kinase family protein n=1 Tax=Crocinitomix catalasitica TaxID=184607 RepID=UPI000484C81C|nr:CotH kinase family protein [Crocinitomix catalasitica]